MRSSTTLPEQPTDYDARVFHNEDTAKTDTVTKLTADMCDTTSGNGYEAPAVTESGSGFQFSQTSLSFERLANATGKTYTVTMLACVRAKLSNTRVGPWRTATKTQSVTKQAAAQ